MENALDHERRISKLEADAQQAIAEINVLQNRVSKHGVELDEIRTKSEVNEAILSRIDETVAKIDARMDESDAKPAQRWESVVTQVISLIVAALFGMLIMQAGLEV